MDTLLHYFPIVLYVLGSALLVVMIILGIKLIKMINKTNAVLDNAYTKIESLNGLFRVIDTITNTVSHISDSVIGNITGIVGKVFHKRKKEEENEEDE